MADSNVAAAWQQVISTASAQQPAANAAATTSFADALLATSTLESAQSAWVTAGSPTTGALADAYTASQVAQTLANNSVDVTMATVNMLNDTVAYSTTALSVASAQPVNVTSPTELPALSGPGDPNTSILFPNTPVVTSPSYNAAVDSQQYNATQGVDTPVAFNPAQDSQAYNNTQSGTTAKDATIASANAQDVSNFQAKEDWRVRLSLSPGSNYLYKSPSGAGILQPLVATDGVIFPYTPNIVVSYAAQYDPTTLTHSNYKIYQYSSSSVDSIAITAEFTAQDTAEANYLLAVIHFFKSVTKMFYGQDQDPQPGTPPPLCYLSGLGEFQFDAHPLAVTAFNYSLPTDVDYIRAGVGAAGAAAQTAATMTVGNNPSASVVRVTTSGLGAGGSALPPAFSASAPYSKPTYVPTRMQISITAVPIVTRYDISQKFSLKDYATGKLLQGTKRQGGGIW